MEYFSTSSRRLVSSSSDSSYVRLFAMPCRPRARRPLT